MKANSQIVDSRENGLVDLSSENAPDYLSGNVRRIEAEKARQERKMELLKQDEKFFEDLMNNVLLPKGFATEKERGFIYLRDKAAQSKCFWETWLTNYKLAQDLNSSPQLKSYIKNEFHENPVVLLNGKMGSLPENLFDTNFYLDKLARFATDFQTEWKTPQFYTKKNEAGTNILIEEYNTGRNLEAEQIVYNIWDLMEDFNMINQKIVEYYGMANEQLSDRPDDPEGIYTRLFNDSRTAKDFEIKRFELLKKYARVIFLVKDNWEKRLDRKYEGFTDYHDVENVINAFLEKRLDLIDSMYN